MSTAGAPLDTTSSHTIMCESLHADSAPGDHKRPSLRARLAAGKELREKTPRSVHAKWQPAAGRPCPLDLLKASNHGRVTQLVPIRYGRMLASPLAFLRGAAATMAYDLSSTPTTGLQVQACGDCHLMNFGAFASPERELLFDINDFDETLAAPWEWDVKRLAASVVLAGRHMGASDRACRDAAEAGVRGYREWMLEYAEMNALEVWYQRIPFKTLVRLSKSPKERKLYQQGARDARARTAIHVITKLVQNVRERRRIVDNPPCIYHPADNKEFQNEVHCLLGHYRDSVPEERRVLLDRYHLIDAAVKVVGVGSVGTRCYVAYLEAGANDALLLQVKEARHSVLEPYCSKSAFANQGQRVVSGQRIMQSASDIFLGWARSERHDYDFYVRQLRDMKGSVSLEAMTPSDLADYADYCGWALARAHARSGDTVRLSGYLGKTGRFDEALAAFAAAYADQTERDHAELKKAVKAGKLHAEVEKAE